MKNIIYIKLLNEGSVAYRPVEAIALSKNVYELKGNDIYDPEDEDWEFSPGTTVIVEERMLSEKLVLIAVARFLNG